MFCINCGKPLEGEQTMCEECKAKQIPIPEDEIFTVHSAAERVDPVEVDLEPEIPVKPKKKHGWIAWIVAAALVVAAAVGILLNMDSVKGFIGRNFQSPEVYLHNLERDAIKEQSTKLLKAYDLALESYGKNLNAPQFAVKSEIGVILGDDILNRAEDALRAQGAAMELDWLRDIRLSVDANMGESATQMGIRLALGDAHLLTADLINDLTGKMIHVALPELNENYLSMELSQGLPGDETPDVSEEAKEITRKFLEALPTEAEMEAMTDAYVELILSNITDVEKSTQTVTIEGVSQKMVVLNARITHKEMLDIAEQIVNKAQTDATIEKMLKALSNYVNEMGALSSSYYEPKDLYQEFLDGIPETLEDLRTAKEESSEEDYLDLMVYVDMKNHIRGHVMDVHSKDEEQTETIRWMTVVEGNTILTEAELGEVRIAGKRTETKGVLEGAYSLHVEDKAIGTLEFEGVTATAGLLRLIPDAAFLQEALSESDIPNVISENLTLEWRYDLQGTKNSNDLTVLVGTSTLLRLTLSTELASGSEITVPTETLRMDVEEDLLQWLQNADLDGFAQTLENAGVSEEIIALVREYANMLKQVAVAP